MKKIAVLTLMLALVFTIVYDRHEIVGYDTYVVTSGDTLWGVAKLSNGYDHMDTREIIYDIEKASNITADIESGDVLQIPIYEED